MRRLYIGRHRQRGVIAIIVAMSIAVLIGFVGLALDLGQLFVTKTELQNAADACALSASSALTGTDANQLIIAENRGMTIAKANKVALQKNDVSAVPSDVRFSETLNGQYFPSGGVAAADILKMKYAKCTLSRNEIKTWFIHVLNVLPGVVIGDQSVSSMAAATLSPSQTTCALPLAICERDLAVQPPFQKGEWIGGKVGANDNITGDFKWVNYIKNNSAKDIKDILTGEGVCNLPSTGEKVGAPGGKGGEAAAWNTRFGIYGGGPYKNAAEAVPDFTGFAYTADTAIKSWPEKFNAYEGASSTGNPNFKTARTANDPYQTDKYSGLKTTGKESSRPTHKNEGSDRRVGIVPVVNCKDFEGGSHEAAIKTFACILMLHPLEQGGGAETPMWLEYIGLTSDASSPCASMGLAGSSTSAGPLVPALVQ